MKTIYGDFKLDPMVVVFPDEVLTYLQTLVDYVAGLETPKPETPFEFWREHDSMTLHIEYGADIWIETLDEPGVLKKRKSSVGPVHVYKSDAHAEEDDPLPCDEDLTLSITASCVRLETSGYEGPDDVLGWAAKDGLLHVPDVFFSDHLINSIAFDFVTRETGEHEKKFIEDMPPDHREEFLRLVKKSRPEYEYLAPLKDTKK